MTDAVTAKLAEWEALTEGGTEGEWRADHETGQVWAAPGEPCLVATAGWVEDAEFIAAARQMVPALLGFVQDVRAMHVSSSESRGVGRVDPETGAWGAYCDHDGEWWPCPTVQALTKRIGGEG